MERIWETPQDRWQKKEKIKVKGFKLKEQLIEDFETACKKAGTNPTRQVRTMMESFIQEVRRNEHLLR